MFRVSRSTIASDETSDAARETRALPLRHFGHALAIEVHFADPLDAREHVVNRLAADAHKLGADDARDEIARQIENLLGRSTLQALAKDSRHCTGQRLHFRSERHANLRLALFIDV